MMTRKSSAAALAFAGSGQRWGKPLPPLLRLGVPGVVASAFLLCVPAFGAGKDKHGRHPAPPPERIAEGQVINGAKKPIEGAVVYLENPTSLDIKSYLTDSKGHYHFSQLAAQTDYEVWAEQNGVQSKHRFISQFSSHTHFEYTLTLKPEKKKKLLGIL